MKTLYFDCSSGISGNMTLGALTEIIGDENYLINELLAEELIKDLGIPTTRVRSHGDIARIEVQKEYFDMIWGNDKLVNDIKKLGFEYVTLDLEGMKSGRFDKM